MRLPTKNIMHCNGLDLNKETYKKEKKYLTDKPIILNPEWKIIKGKRGLIQSYIHDKKEIDVKFLLPEYLYYASKERLTELNTSGKSKIIKATPYYWMAIIESGYNKSETWSSEDLSVKRVISADGAVPYLEEKYKGAFDKFFSKPIYVYVLHTNDFVASGKGHNMGAYAISKSKIKPVKRIRVAGPNKILKEMLGDNLHLL
jgi:hypothetical protein